MKMMIITRTGIKNEQIKGESSIQLIFFLFMRFSFWIFKNKKFAGKIVGNHDKYIGTDFCQCLIPVEDVHSDQDKGHIKYEGKQSAHNEGDEFLP